MSEGSVRAGIGALALLCSPAVLATSYDEATNGDLSNSGLAPTAITLNGPSNVVTGAFGASLVPNQIDRDYFAVTVPPGFRLARMNLKSLVVGGASSFFGVQVGPQVTMPPTSFDPSPLLGWNHVAPSQVGLDLLPLFDVNGGLAAGTYSFWLQDTDGTGIWPWSVDFVLEAVPEATPRKVPSLGPVALALLWLGSIWVYAAQRDRRIRKVRRR